MEQWARLVPKIELRLKVERELVGGLAHAPEGEIQGVSDT